jgi:2-dehydropantoate 2-reductase
LRSASAKGFERNHRWTTGFWGGGFGSSPVAGPRVTAMDAKRRFVTGRLRSQPGVSMDIAILGTGGVGGYYGGVLARAGHSVRLWARGDNLEALQQRGLEVRTPDDTFTVKLPASGAASELGPVELAVVAVKSYSLAEVAGPARTLALGGALLLPLLNGTEVAEQLTALGVPKEALLGGLTMLSAVRVAPGVVEQKSRFASITVGELGGGTSARVGRVVAAFRRASVDIRESADVEVDLWQKFVFIASLATVCGLARTSIGAVRSAPGGGALIAGAVREAVAVARARGVRLPDEQEARTVASIEGLAPTMRPSLLVDLQRGGPTELDALMGMLSRLGGALGVPTPIHSTAAAALAASLAPAFS